MEFINPSSCTRNHHHVSTLVFSFNHSTTRKCLLSYTGPKYEDPLKSALDRGSGALDFLSSPLVLDYVHVKFTGTLPAWTSRDPFQPNVNEGFYKYDFYLGSTAYPESAGVHGSRATNQSSPVQGSLMPFLLRSVTSERLPDFQPHHHSTQRPFIARSSRCCQCTSPRNSKSVAVGG